MCGGAGSPRGADGHRRIWPGEAPEFAVGVPDAALSDGGREGE